MPRKDKQKNAEYNKLYREKNKELLKQKARKRYLENREKKLERQKKYRQENLEKERARCREYHKKNRESILEKNKVENCSLEKKKVLKIRKWIQSGFKHTAKELNEIADKYFELEYCECCNKKFEGKTTKACDHCHLSGSFRHILCMSCNSERKRYDNQRYLLMLELHRYFNINFS
jgi:hypothetical protein